MFIQTETTPNPRTLKFIPGQEVMGDQGTASFTDKDLAKSSPLAEVLFTLDGVEEVFLGSDFISVTVLEEDSWDILKPYVLTTIMEHFVSGRNVLDEGNKGQGKPKEKPIEEEKDPIVRQIREIIDTKVRPAVAQDGGDIIYRDFQEGVVLLELYGACSGCPSATATLKQGIESMLQHFVPEVISVEAVNM